MKSVHSEFDQVAGHLHEMMNKLWQWHSGDFGAESWSPATNIYRFPRRVEVCVDLAGLEPKAIDVHVGHGRLSIRGLRRAPEPTHSTNEPMRIDAMEINHGQFCRTIAIPEGIDLARVESQYLNGFLWIRLPLREPG